MVGFVLGTVIGVGMPVERWSPVMRPRVTIVPGAGSFDTQFDNKNFFVDRPGSPASVIENLGTHRAMGGVSKANLGYNGAFNASPEPVAAHDFHGVIRP
jgi:hypothetical protein